MVCIVAMENHNYVLRDQPHRLDGTGERRHGEEGVCDRDLLGKIKLYTASYKRVNGSGLAPCDVGVGDGLVEGYYSLV